jgi:uncharacterized membrane protein HdeD (DUF308 family)
MLITLGFVALILGIVLIVAGYTAAPAALRPGWGVLILGIILLLLGYLLPAFHTTDYDNDGHVGMAVLTQVH